MRNPFILSIAILACLIVAISAFRASAQPFPQSPAGSSTRLVGKHVIIHLQNSSAVAPHRSRVSEGPDPIVHINDSPVSIAGTISGYSNEGGARWIILTRREAGDAWIPLDVIHLIEVSTNRPSR